MEIAHSSRSHCPRSPFVRCGQTIVVGVVTQSRGRPSLVGPQWFLSWSHPPLRPTTVTTRIAAEGLGRREVLYKPFRANRNLYDHFRSSTHRVYGKKNSRPYRGAASNILSTSPYAGSFSGGNVIAGAGTVNSLKNPSNPAGVTRRSIRYCSDSMVNE